MKRILVALCMLWGLGLSAQSLRVQVDSLVPEAAAVVLLQRFTQMAEAGGMTVVADEGTPVLLIQAVPADRMEMPGDGKQVAVVLSVSAVMEDVSGTFTVKGVGEGDADAWQRAARQILPHSKAARELASRLKEALAGDPR